MTADARHEAAGSGRAPCSGAPPKFKRGVGVGVGVGALAVERGERPPCSAGAPERRLPAAFPGRERAVC